MKHNLLKQVLGFPEQEDRLNQLLSHVKLVLAVRYIAGPNCLKGCLNSSPIDEFGCRCLQSWWSQAMLWHEGEVSMGTLRAAPPGTVTLNNLVEYLPTSTYLAQGCALRKIEGSPVL